MIEIPTLESWRLRLRAPGHDDLESVHNMIANEDVAEFVFSGKPGDRTKAFQVLALDLGHWHLHGFGCWVVEERETGAFVGRAGLQHPEGYPHMEVCWMLGRRFWGNGYASEAASTSAQFGFNVLCAEYLISLIDPRNGRSQNVARRIGSKMTADMHTYPEGYQDNIWQLDKGDLKPC